MTDTLVTAVGNVITRVLIMEPLAVPNASYASKRWIEFRQDWPYWCNRPTRMPRPTGGEDTPTYELEIQMRLILAHLMSATREDVAAGTANVQDKAWEYLPAVLRYFEKYRFLNPPGYAEINYLSPVGTTITSMSGMSLVVLPGTNEAMVSLDFTLTVPLQVGTED